ncbi:hypothetical protein F7Q99_17790 [Streptomyces kaniharaensis]|uniref:Uncharacterized protein n=1 Tax=Streptomyces kaniharaensis TaxID=212423 RepID=A0A6N7KVR2_9ACTN|nr:hypothetical protein [Streptomyces kaniharaensis]MQS14074.1 hypothetical protein [Streptomyces kaniharaensis]
MSTAQFASADGEADADGDAEAEGVAVPEAPPEGVGFGVVLPVADGFGAWTTGTPPEGCADGRAGACGGCAGWAGVPTRGAGTAGAGVIAGAGVAPGVADGVAVGELPGFSRLLMPPTMSSIRPVWDALAVPVGLPW